jgi:hypothetical protein
MYAVFKPLYVEYWTPLEPDRRYRVAGFSRSGYSAYIDFDENIRLVPVAVLTITPNTEKETIMTAVTEPESPPAVPVLDLTGPVTFEQYQAALRGFQAEFIRLATEQGWNNPSATLRKITREFPERRNGEFQFDQLYPEITPEDLTEDGLVKFNEMITRQYAERLALYRRRVLGAAGNYWTLEQANRVLAAAGIPGWEPPKLGNPYRAESFPVLEFYTESNNLTTVTTEFRAKFTEWLDANGYRIADRYNPPTIRRGAVAQVPATEKAELLG